MCFYKLASLISLSLICSAQAPPLTFLQQLSALGTAGKVPQTITLSGHVDWTAGSTHESGTVSLDASASGSASDSFNLAFLANGESFGPWQDTRICSWTDAKGVVAPVLGAGCITPVIWFAPSLSLPARLTDYLSFTDNGEFSSADLKVHRVTVSPNIDASSPHSTDLVNATSVQISYDPLTFQVLSVDYKLHADHNLHVEIPVTVIFSDYRSVGAFTLPFHIERYLNGTKQLVIQADTIIAN